MGLLGSWGKRGGFYNKEKIKVPKFPHPKYPHPKWGWHSLAEDYPFAQMGLTQEIIRASIPEEDTKHKVKAWFVSGTNLPNTIPNRPLLTKAIESLDFYGGSRYYAYGNYWIC